MPDQLTESQQKWYDLAAMHADDFAQRAGQHDEENSRRRNYRWTSLGWTYRPPPSPPVISPSAVWTGRSRVSIWAVLWAAPSQPVSRSEVWWAGPLEPGK